MCLLWWLSYCIYRVGVCIWTWNTPIPSSLACQFCPVYPLSVFRVPSGGSCHIHLLCVWFLGIKILGLKLVWQVLYPLKHFPSPRSVLLLTHCLYADIWKSEPSWTLTSSSNISHEGQSTHNASGAAAATKGVFCMPSHRVFKVILRSMLKTEWGKNTFL